MTEYKDDWEDVDDWQDVPVDDGGVDDWQDVEVPQKSFGQNVKETFSDSMGSISDAASSGFGPAISGASGAVLDPLFGQNPDKNLLERYRHHRGQALGERKARGERSPVASTIFSVLGGLVTPNPAAKAGLVKQALSGAAQGGLAGLGYSEADLTKGDVKGAALDSLMGGGIGGVLPTVAPTIKWTGKKGIHAISGVHPKLQERYVSRPQQVRSSGDREEITDKLQENIKSLKKQVMKDSKAAVAKIPEDSMLSVEEIRKVFSEVIDKQMDSSLPEVKRSAKYLKNIMKNINKKAGKEEQIPFRYLKKTIQDFDTITEYSDTVGSFDNAKNLAKKDVRAKLDSILKGAFPDYKDAMIGVSDKTRVLNEASGMFGGKESGVAAKLKSMASKPQDKITENRILGDLDHFLKSDLSGENADRLVREAFEKGNTAGSRNVNMGGIAGFGLGSLLDQGGVAGWILGPMGATAGYMVDKWGPKGAQKILDAYIVAKGANAPGAKALMQALKNANVSHGITTGVIAP